VQGAPSVSVGMGLPVSTYVTYVTYVTVGVGGDGVARERASLQRREGCERVGQLRDGVAL
jgi:hypothetical protein